LLPEWNFDLVGLLPSIMGRPWPTGGCCTKRRRRRRRRIRRRRRGRRGRLASKYPKFSTLSKNLLPLFML